MLSTVGPGRGLPVLREMKEFDEPQKSSLLGRVSLNWETAILFCNVALIIMGIAYAYFIKLPLISFGLGFYALFYLAIYGRVKQEKNKDLVVKDKEKLSEKDQKIALQQDLRFLEAKVGQAKANRVRYDKEARVAKAERDSLKREVAAYKSARS